MDIEIKRIKRYFFRKIKYSHVYAAQCRRLWAEDLANTLHDFSRAEYNQAMEIFDILEDRGHKIKNISKIIMEINSAWTGLFSTFLGKRFVVWYDLHLERRSLIVLKKIKISNINGDTFSEIEKEELEHQKYFKNYFK